MSVGIDSPRILRSTHGRVRVHSPGWTGRGCEEIEAAIASLPGVQRVRAAASTQNILVEFDESLLGRTALLARVRRETAATNRPAARRPARAPRRPAAGPVHLEDAGPREAPLKRARIGVRGLERDPEIARRVLRRLSALAGVRRVSVSQLTGRVLIEFDEHQVAVEDLLGHLTSMDLPDLPSADYPEHPLDAAPLIRAGTRAAGALAGLGLVATRRLLGKAGPPVASGGPLAVAAIVGVLEGLPPLRRTIRSRLGAERAELVVGVVNLTALSLAGSPLGLAVNAAVGVRRFTEIRARRAAWRDYERRLPAAQGTGPGQVVRLAAGQRAPMAGRVIEGEGTMIGQAGLPLTLSPGDIVPGGARVSGGPFVLELRPDRAFEPLPRPCPLPPTHLDAYLRALSPAALGYAALTAVLTRSLTRTMTALLLVNARPALIGSDVADSSASTRVLRSGVTVLGSRQGRGGVRLPDVLIIDNPRVLSDRRLEIARVSSLRADIDPGEVLAIAAGIAAASGSPWGPAFPLANRAVAAHGSFEGGVARAQIGGSPMSLAPLENTGGPVEGARRSDRGSLLLALSRDSNGRALGLIALRSRLEPGAAALLAGCATRGVDVELLGDPDSAAARDLAERAGLSLRRANATTLIRERQRQGLVVAHLSDSPHAAPAFAAADLAIALTSGRSGHFAARADLLAPDLASVAAIVKAAALRRAAADDAIALSVVSNIAGAIWGLRGAPGIERGSHATYLAALGATVLAVARLSGGLPSRSAAARMVDPEPEKWGRVSVPEVFRRLEAGPAGLTSEAAAERAVHSPAASPQSPLTAALGEQLRSPLNGALVCGAAISLLSGAVADIALIGAVLVANAAVGVWQEHQAGRATAMLARQGEANVSVLREGVDVKVRATELVRGDLISLGSGDRVPADARIVESDSLEVDEAALTGESLPVSKGTNDPTDAGRVLLEGSDVTVGTALAVVFATGRDTRMGATAEALSVVEPARGALDSRLNALVRQSFPILLGGAAIMGVSGLVWRRPLAGQLALAASVATAAVPEGLPLLAGVAEAAVARRLAGRKAFVRRLAAVEALGRVDIACTDKTGTLTTGHLSLTRVETFAGTPSSQLEEREVLLIAALASPHPDAPAAGAHPTDLAVLEGARARGLEDEMRIERDREMPFDPARGFHVSAAGERVLLKGAAEALAPRCRAVRRAKRDLPLDEDGAAELLDAAARLSSRGLRVLMIAEGTPGTSLEDPHGLVAVGLIGISDPLREGVPAAIVRCHDAGVRVIMLTGDHPATARAVAEQAGLEVGGDQLLTGEELSELDDDALGARLERVGVIARITPLDKLRIIERLQAGGHTVAMTGDGVNDAPALRLADVGVAMGLHGTEVARQASDVVLADDDFATLVETLVEGRSFWLNLRRSLGLLLGGNLGEIGMMVGASVIGLASPLTTRQILAVNLITDTLPAVAVAAQQPENRDLAVLAREGGSERDAALRSDILRRGLATAGPSLAAYGLATLISTPAQARTVAFGAIVATQLAQTLSVGRAEGTLTRPVLGAAIGSGGFALAGMLAPPMAGFLGLAAPTLLGALLTAGAVLASLTIADGAQRARPALGAGPLLPSLPLAVAG